MPRPVMATRRAIAQVTTGDTGNLPSEIVVTGIGVATSIGLTAEAALHRVLRAEPGFCPVPAYELSGLRAPKNQKFLSASARHLMWAGLQAVDRSGWRRETLMQDRTAVFTGSGQVGLEPAQMFPAFRAAQTSEGLPDWAAFGGAASRLLDPYFPLRALSNSGLALLAMELGARGPSNNFVQSDTAGVRAIDAAIGALEEGLCDVAICGAFDSLLTPANDLNFRRMELVSARGRMKPFDRAADGLVLGEGGAALVLERRRDAERRGAPILAGISLDESGPPDFIVAAGLGLPLTDREEARGIDRDTPCTAFKGATGYLGAATAVVEIALAISALRARVVPAVVGLCEPAEGIGLRLICGDSLPLPAGRPVSARCWSRSWFGERAAVTVEAD